MGAAFHSPQTHQREKCIVRKPVFVAWCFEKAGKQLCNPIGGDGVCGDGERRGIVSVEGEWRWAVSGGPEGIASFSIHGFTVEFDGGSEHERSSELLG